MRYLWIVLLALSLFLLSPFGHRTLLIALAIACLSALYSAPQFHMKGVPMISTAIHLAGGLLHFLLGYSLFAPVDARGLEVAAFFALAFAAGHLTHETRDRHADLLNHISTNAVRFGERHSFIAAVALFTAADLWLILLAVQKRIPGVLLAVVPVAAARLYWSAQTYRGGLDFDSVRLLQVRYRVLYACVGLLLFLAVLA